jgi:predicted aspartyl protease
MLDTGYALTMIHPAHTETLALKRVGHVTIVGIAGEEAADTLTGASFDLAGATYLPSRVASLPSEASRRGRRRDGILGNGFFKRFIVEVDPRAKTITLHEPKEFQYAGAGEIVPLTFKKTTPIVEASVNTPGGETVMARFEIDTGCTGGLCLGRDFVQANHLDPDEAAARGGTRTGVGGAARTRDGHVPQLKFGKLSIDKPEASFFQEGSPVDAGLAGHIGLDVLRHFKIVFDYSRQRMILESYAAKTAP